MRLAATWHLLVAALFSAAAHAAPGPADDFPNRPIRLIVGFSPGGGADISARIIATKASEILGAQIIIDNRPGAGANIAAEAVAKSKPDGYTLLHTTTAHAIAPSLYKKLNYDYLKDFAPIAPLGAAGFVLAVHPSLGVNTVGEFVAYAKKAKPSLSYGSSGVGGPSHLATELFTSMTGTDLQHVPYRGINPALVDLLAGRAPVGFMTLPTALPLMRNKQVVALGLSSMQRSSLAPQLPTIAESGVAGYSAETWYGALAPTGTPEAILDKLHAAFAQTMRDPSVQAKLLEQGFDIRTGGRVEFAAYIRAETGKWTRIVKAAGVTAEE
ncbi:MAG: tripartite tricarboxylate transporter substrate binding protein [Ramlibacter sp.]|uniref:tripartite tricarboxylate transporter substrate binding protein n=1 Tax=Ramlibacter sp. TaxID=1917967 RepID=UPI0026136554|nr:tripartite tricarboxylate transporter substrate binding protein [Ramlibacter sp.]MDH4378153.1 tripartite tricarboxylate transporter substrate binding protein [Ramlibacter sp.]